MRPKGTGYIIPADFKEVYLTAKKKYVTDIEIALDYVIDTKTLAKWKKAVGFKAGDFAENKKRRRKA
jgi:hypothetical protein